ncbi:hypothetical protein KIN20_014679 [Parelaphostrongylus tenuis]|uniref:Uncharacterized protein n=1 Tax=Parelaphostrongylus tenuis TaxID=148309 RepID=A0AAD5N3I4_PARTN|nr:hypothetical protein KIN20_014679 [Parelaphostrongylus tenuis]
MLCNVQDKSIDGRWLSSILKAHQTFHFSYVAESVSQFEATCALIASPQAMRDDDNAWSVLQTLINIESSTFLSMTPYQEQREQQEQRIMGNTYNE